MVLDLEICGSIADYCLVNDDSILSFFQKLQVKILKTSIYMKFQHIIKGGF